MINFLSVEQGLSTMDITCKAGQENAGSQAQAQVEKIPVSPEPGTQPAVNFSARCQASPARVTPQPTSVQPSHNNRQLSAGKSGAKTAPCQSGPANLCGSPHVVREIAAQTGPSMLDLFSGSNSVGDKFRQQGYEVISLDILPRGSPNICKNVLKWDYREFSRGYFDVIAAGLPCEDYSNAKVQRPRDFDRADALVARTLEIIEYFQPRIWWIENPRFGFLRTREIIHHLPYIDVDYCQFSSWGYQKPTRIWCCPQIFQLPSVFCDKKTCRNLIRTSWGTLKHRETLGGNCMRFSPKQKRADARCIGGLFDECTSIA